MWIRYACTKLPEGAMLVSASTSSALAVSIRVLAKRPVTDLTGKTQAVLPPSTVKRFLEANKLPHKEGHAALTLPCPLCERATSQSVFTNKTTGGLVCPPCKVHGELVHLVDKWSCQ